MKVLSYLFLLVFSGFVIADHSHSKDFDIIAVMSIIVFIVVLGLLLHEICIGKDRYQFRKAIRKLEKILYTGTDSADAINLLKFINSVAKGRINVNDQKTANEFTDRIQGYKWMN